MEKQKTHTIMILSDGSTYTDVSGCEILTLTDEGMRILEEGYEPKDIPEEEILTSIHLQ